MAAPVSQNANTLALITNEVLANSLGGTLVANNLQVTNSTANNSVIEFLLAGQSLPITNGSVTIYPSVNVAVYVGANGNQTDQQLMQCQVISTQDQNGAFVLNGMLTLKANANHAPTGNQVWGGVLQAPGTSLGGDVKALQAVYAGPASNGNVNCAMVSGTTTANISFFVQPATGQNCNASITTLVVFAPIGVI